MTEAPVKTLITVMIVAGILLDVVVWWKRKHANWLIYYELISMLLQGFVPFDIGDFRSITLLFLVVQTFI